MGRELQSLQILRAVAATSVIYYHIGAGPVFGSFGVDLFFVLSGFVMAKILDTPTSVLNFALGRIARIVPLYWALTTGLLLLAALKPDLLNSTTANLWNYAKSLLFVPYFKENGTLRPMLAVGWTLNYEMFFYACIGISLLVSKKRYQLITGLLICSAYFLVGSRHDGSAASVFFSNAQPFEFLLGMLLFNEYQKGRLAAVSGPLAIKLSVLMVALAYGFMAFAEAFRIRANELWLYGIPSLLLLAGLLRLESVMAPRPNRLVAWLTRMGDASYATYLSHYYVVEAFRKVLLPKISWIEPDGPAAIVVIMLACLLTGDLLYRYADRPLSDFFRKRLLNKPRAFAMTGPAATVGQSVGKSEA